MFVLVLSLFSVVSAIPINNGIVGEPEFACGSKSLILSLNTETPWEGTFYVKNFFTDENCKTKGTGTQNAKLELDFTTCGVKRERSLEPQGLFISATVVMSFHTIFITKVDRTFTVRCFYMESDKTVSQDLEVSLLTTKLQRADVTMPTCFYEILEGGPGGDKVEFAIVGQQVYHKWTCETEAVDTFCMRVFDCFVDDGTGDTTQLIDDDGCSIDKFLLGNLEYPMDLMAGQEAHVFKFADRSQLYFNCQIALTIKEVGGECPKPNCRRRRRKRLMSMEPKEKAAITDVSPSHPLLVADIDLAEEDIPSGLIHSGKKSFPVPSPFPQPPIRPKQGYCFSQTVFGLIIGTGALFLITALSIITLLCGEKANIIDLRLKSKV